MNAPEWRIFFCSSRSKSSQMSFPNEEEIKSQPLVSTLLTVKCLSTAPFYVVGMYAPEYLSDFTWILYNESFYHYHARIFYLLALYRSLSQLYFAVWGNGLVQRRFVMLECLFDVGVIALYIHEYYRLHNIKIFMTKYLILHSFFILVSLLCLKKTEKTKFLHPV